MIFVKGTNKYGEMVVMWLLQLNVGLLLHVLRSSSLGSGSALGKKRKNGVKQEKYRQAKRAQRQSGQGKVARLQISRLASDSPIFVFLFPPMRSMVPGYCSSQYTGANWCTFFLSHFLPFPLSFSLKKCKQRFFRNEDNCTTLRL